MDSIQSLIERAELSAVGSYTRPDLDIKAIEHRANALEPSDQIKADLVLLIAEVKRLRNANR